MIRFTRVVVIIFLAFFSTGLFAQSLHGIVRAFDNAELLAGATVKLKPAQSDGLVVTATSGTDGSFHFDNLRPGYYRCEIGVQGFEVIYFDEILVAAGKAPQLEAGLKRVTSTLPEVTVSSSMPGRRPVQPLGEIPLSRDRMLRYPNMYFDPGRLATAYGGVAQVDDG
ncbi:MAG: carboxypeptidase-like regulatory domain-containing protein, partial [Bacteroidota bacterium]